MRSNLLRRFGSAILVRERRSRGLGSAKCERGRESFSGNGPPHGRRSLRKRIPTWRVRFARVFARFSNFAHAYFCSVTEGKILPACRARVLRLPGQERGRLGPIVASEPNDLAGKRRGFGSREWEIRGAGPFVASKPKDLAGKRRGFRSHSTPRNGNKNGIKPIGLDKYKSNTPLPTPFP
jgi:hypothetical protein